LQGPRRGDQLGSPDPRRLARQGRSAARHRLRRAELIDQLDEIIRIEGGQVLATLIRLTGDIDRAEDALHDAVVVAADAWRRDGVPDKPGAWLTTVARNKALDRLRREARRAPKEAEAFRLLTADAKIGGSEMDDSDADNRDDRLRLLFTCCHPALSPESQVALALRTICGFSTVDIARVFLVPEATIGQRISRSKAKIAKAHIPYRVPEAHELPDRLPPVLTTVYAVFTAGHHAPVGELDARLDLADEAIRLARVLVELMPDEAECIGLLALTLATDARRSARTDDAGDIVLLADQDRSRWDLAAIAEASALVESVLRRGRPGAYQMQAAIACLHGVAPTYADTDWPQIAELYRLLEMRWPTAVVRVNRAVAVAEVAGPRAGLALLAELAGGPTERWHLYWSTRADFHRRLGETDAAVGSYRRAVECPCNDSDQRFLRRRLAEFGVDGP
jgi:RNA polymerase sigma-70 factor (ECF subfamily)